MDAEGADVDSDMDLGMGMDLGMDDADMDLDADMGAIESGQPPAAASEAVDPGAARDRAETAMVVPELEPTGHAEVDATLERLRELSEQPTGAHPDLYDGVHQRLQEVLAQIDHQDAGR